MKKLFVTAVFVFGMVFAVSAQDRSPAMGGKSSTKKEKVQAQGYIKGKESNTQQGKQLKALEAQEKKDYAPKPKPKAKGTVIDQ